MIVNIKNAARSAATIVLPTGVPARMEIKRPVTEHITETAAEQIVTERKLLKTLMADKAGKIIKAEINSEPAKFMAKTITTATITAINKL